MHKCHEARVSAHNTLYTSTRSFPDSNDRIDTAGIVRVSTTNVDIRKISAPRNEARCLPPALPAVSVGLPKARHGVEAGVRERVGAGAVDAAVVVVQDAVRA